MDIIKQSHTSSELTITKGSLLRVRLTYHSPLNEQKTGTESRSRKRESMCAIFTAVFMG